MGQNQKLQEQIADLKAENAVMKKQRRRIKTVSGSSKPGRVAPASAGLEAWGLSLLLGLGGLVGVLLWRRWT